MMLKKIFAGGGSNILFLLDKSVDFEKYQNLFVVLTDNFVKNNFFGIIVDNSQFFIKINLY